MYGFDNVVATSKTLRSLDPVSFSFIVNLSGQPREAFRCYTLNQSVQVQRDCDAEVIGEHVLRLG